MASICVVLALSLASVFADIGDYESVKGALSLSKIQRSEDDIQLTYSAFDDAHERIKKSGKNIHPLLSFIAACVESANPTLLKLAIFITSSYDRDKTFIEKAFNLKWGAKEGNQDEQNIYKIVGLASAKKDNGQSLGPQAISFMLQYKVFGRSLSGGSPVDYVSFSDLAPYVELVHNKWPGFFSTQDEDFLISRRYLKARNNCESDIVARIQAVGTTQQCEDQEFVRFVVSAIQKADGSKHLFITEKEDTFLAVGILESLWHEYLKKNEPLVVPSAPQPEPQPRPQAAPVVVPPVQASELPYTVVSGTSNQYAVEGGQSVCAIAAVMAAKRLLSRPITMPSSLIDGWLTDAAKVYKDRPHNGSEHLDVVEAIQLVEAKFESRTVCFRGGPYINWEKSEDEYLPEGGAFSLNRIVDYLTKDKNKPAAAIIVRGGVSVVLIWKDNKIYFFNSHGEPSKKDDKYDDSYKKAFIVTFYSSDAAKKELLKFAPLYETDPEFRDLDDADVTFLELPKA